MKHNRFILLIIMSLLLSGCQAPATVNPMESTAPAKETSTPHPKTTDNGAETASISPTARVQEMIAQLHLDAPVENVVGIALDDTLDDVLALWGEPLCQDVQFSEAVMGEVISLQYADLKVTLIEDETAGESTFHATSVMVDGPTLTGPLNIRCGDETADVLDKLGVPASYESSGSLIDLWMKTAQQGVYGEYTDGDLVRIVLEYEEDLSNNFVIIFDEGIVLRWGLYCHID